MEGGFYYRNPNTRGGVFSSDGGQSLLVGDLTGNLSGNCPTVPIENHVPDQQALQEVEANPNCFVFNQGFPGGFTPTFGGTVRDLSAAVGIRGDISDWHYDLSAVFGQHSTDFFMTNTINPQLVAKSEYDVSNIPTNYNPGSYTETDRVFNLDLSRPLETNMFYSPLNLALGFEYRIEAFDVEAGGENSWYIDRDLNNAAYVGLAAQGFGRRIPTGLTAFLPTSRAKTTGAATPPISIWKPTCPRMCWSAWPAGMRTMKPSEIP